MDQHAGKYIPLVHETWIPVYNLTIKLLKVIIGMFWCYENEYQHWEFITVVNIMLLNTLDHAMSITHVHYQVVGKLDKILAPLTTNPLSSKVTLLKLNHPLIRQWSNGSYCYLFSD